MTTNVPIYFVKRTFTGADVLEILDAALREVRTSQGRARRKVEELRRRCDLINLLGLSLDKDRTLYAMATNFIQWRRTQQRAIRDGVTRLRRHLPEELNWIQRYNLADPAPYLKILEAIEAEPLDRPPLLAPPWHARSVALADTTLVFWIVVDRHFIHEACLRDLLHLLDLVDRHFAQEANGHDTEAFADILRQTLPRWGRDGLPVCFIEAALRRIGADPPSRRAIEGVIREAFARSVPTSNFKQPWIISSSGPAIEEMIRLKPAIESVIRLADVLGRSQQG